jgi:hypothetical protein
MEFPILEDVSQLARLRWTINSLENLAIQVYFSAPVDQLKLKEEVVPNRAVIDTIIGALAVAYTEIAQAGGLRATVGKGVSSGGSDCAPGFCPEGGGCVPCGAPQLAWPSR